MEQKENYIKVLSEVINKIDLKELEKVAFDIKYPSNRRVFLCGNGGSSSTCQHIANDFIKMCGIDATCLTDNIAAMTAYANDISYEEIFVEQLKKISKYGDILIVISGSGKSKNILKAIEYGIDHHLCIICIIGGNNQELSNKSLDHVIYVETDMQHFEDCSLIIGHILTLNMV